MESQKKWKENYCYNNNTFPELIYELRTIFIFSSDQENIKNNEQIQNGQWLFLKKKAYPDITVIRLGENESGNEKGDDRFNERDKYFEQRLTHCERRRNFFWTEGKKIELKKNISNGRK